MDKLIRFNSQSTGRDRLFRLVQYSSRLIWAHLEKASRDKDIINKLKNLEYSLSTARKLYRFGRSLDTLYGALSSIHLNDPTLRYTLTFSKISNALYLLSDHVLWMGRIGLISIDKTKWSNASYKLWLYYLVMNLARDLYEILRVVDQVNSGGLDHEFMSVLNTRKPTFLSKLRFFYMFLSLHKNILVDTVKNGCDVCLPLTQLGYLNFSPAMVGLLGVISSLAGILPLVDPSYKMLPS